METVSGVRGELLRWARERQGLTMRWIHDHGGPSPSYQCEVEKGKKSQVQSDTLDRWVRVLNVTDQFVRGHVTKYHQGAVACRGLAADVAALVMAAHSELLEWSEHSEQDRVRRVLRLVANHSRSLPRVVLAWVLDMTPDTFDAMLVGQHPVLRPHLEATIDLTMLPETFFTYGSTFEQYVPVFRQALAQGLTPAALLRLMSRPSLGASGDALHGVQDDGPLGAGGGSRDNSEEHRQQYQQPD